MSRWKRVLRSIRPRPTDAHLDGGRHRLRHDLRLNQVRTNRGNLVVTAEAPNRVSAERAEELHARPASGFADAEHGAETLRAGHCARHGQIRRVTHCGAETTGREDSEVRPRRNLAEILNRVGD